MHNLYTEMYQVINDAWSVMRAKIKLRTRRQDNYYIEIDKTSLTSTKLHFEQFIECTSVRIHTLLLWLIVVFVLL